MTTERQHLSIQSNTDTDAIRREMFEGKEHLVIPIIALVEGVIHPSNASVPELALASEFGKHVLGWNGRPVLLNHPEIDGVKVSANIPQVIEDQVFGQLFNSSLDGTKLKTEAWINIEKVKSLGGDVEKTINSIEEGELTEVSTGLFTDLELEDGRFNGKEFKGVWRNVTPDHLAILPEGIIGACNNEMGCGTPRVNESCSCKTDPCSCDTKTNTSDTSDTSVFKELFTKFKDLITFRGNGDILSDVDIRSALNTALSAKDSPNTWIVAVFKDTFVYEDWSEGALLQRSFKIKKNGSISLGEEVTKVRPVTEFIPISVNQENEMAKTRKESVDALIGNEASPFTEDDSEYLSNVSDEKFTSLEAFSVSKSDAEENTETVVKESATTNNEAPVKEAPTQTTDSRKEVTVESYIKEAPEEIREVLNSGVQMHRNQREALVKALTTNARCSFTEKELQDMSIVNLQKIAQLGDLPDYSGNGGSPRMNTDEDASSAPPMPEAFPRKTA